MDGESPRPPVGGSEIARLRGHEERLRALRARRTDLEVERIVAGVALRSARSGASAVEVPGADADAVVEALDRLRRLESGPAACLAFADAGAGSHDELLERLRAGDDALGAWLDADREDAGAAGRRVAKQALLVACLVILVLSFMVHPVFLVLLVPAGGAMSFLLWTGQDGAWRRTGARRRFERLRLEAPAAWTGDAVRERRRALSLVAERVRERGSGAGDGGGLGDGGGDPEEEGGPTDLDTRRSGSNTPPKPEEEEGPADLDTRRSGSNTPPKPEEEGSPADLDTARSDLREALAAAGLPGDRLDGADEAALRAIAGAFRAEQGLHEVAEEMANERSGAGALREPIYRHLARAGEAPPDGDAGASALEAGAEKVERVEKAEKAERVEKAEKAERVEKAEKAERVEKAEKVERAGRR